jgi:hypothetical protein
MDIEKKIKDWLVSGSYFEGVALYRWVQGEYPVRYFEGYEGASYIPEEVEFRLRNSLQKAVENLPNEEMTEIPSLEEENDRNSVNENTPTTVEPATIQLLRSEAKLLHKTHSLVHARMVDATKDEMRYGFAKQIMEEIIPSLDAIYDKIRGWQDTGELPPATTSNRDRYIIEKMLRRNSLKSRISRINSTMGKGMNEVEKMKLQKELLEKEVELKEIDEEFGL